MHHTLFTQPSVGHGTEQVKNPYPITTLPDGTAWLSLHSLRCSAHQTALLSLLSWLPASFPHFPNWITLLHRNFHCCQSKTTALYHAVRHTKHCFCVCWVVIWCLSCFYFGWTLRFSLLKAPECIF